VKRLKAISIAIAPVVLDAETIGRGMMSEEQKYAKFTQAEWELILEAMKDRYLNQDGSESFMIAGILGGLQEVITWNGHNRPPVNYDRWVK
jgi:hypothetical protein